MKHLEKSYKVVRDNPWLWLLPLAIAMFSFFWSLSMGLWPLIKPGFHVKFAVPSGLPSMSQVLQSAQVPLAGGAGLELLGGLAGILSLAISAYISGGWVHSVFTLLNGEAVSQDAFFAASSKFFLRLVVLRLLNILVLSVTILPLGLLFPPLALAAMLFVMAFTFFWELAVIKGDFGVIEGLQRGWGVFKSNVGDVLSLALIIGLATAILSGAINSLAQSMVTYPLAAVTWSFVGSVFSVAISDFYASHSGSDQSPQQM